MVYSRRGDEHGVAKFLVWFIPIPIVYLIENAILKKRGRKPSESEHPYAMLVGIVALICATTSPLAGGITLIFFSAILTCSNIWGGIGQRFESKEYSSYFRALVRSECTDGENADAVVKLQREHGVYSVRDIYILNGSTAKHFHFGSIMCDTSITPLCWSQFFSNELQDGVEWNIVITDRKPVGFDSASKELYVD